MAIAPKAIYITHPPEFHLQGEISETDGSLGHPTWIGRTIAGVAEDPLLRGSYEVVVHEFAHAVQNLCFSEDDHTEWNRFYWKVRRANLFYYAPGMTSPLEFFAEFSESYFDRPGEIQRQWVTWERPDDELTRQKLAADFPEIFSFLEGIYEAWEVGSYFGPDLGLLDREVLVKLYNSTDGSNWINNENWLSDKPLGEWYGVAIGDNRRVTRLEFDYNRLGGEIPPELGNLANLEAFSSVNNHLTGELPPELGKLANLEELMVSAGQLTGEIPPELANLANLRRLDLWGNRLTGEIPPELANLANLEELDLGHSRLTGEIPPELANLANLRRLVLWGNQLTGEIPPELGKLANLRILFLDDNQLTGEIPPEIGNLVELRDLFLDDNQLTGEIPPELGNLTEVRRLYLQGNQLTGEIPPEFGNLARVRFLNLWENQLTGEIPSELGELPNLERLYLRDNQLTGEIPTELGNLAELRKLAIEDNRLTGEIPAGIGQPRQFSGSAPMGEPVNW